MNHTLFIRLLHHNDKGSVLSDKISAVNEGQLDGDVYAVKPESFRHVPNTPFCYWVSERVRQLFKDFPAFETDNRKVRIGMKTGDDNRFLRLWFEIPGHGLGWVPYAKGGRAQSFYSDFPVLVNWNDDGKQIKEFVASRMVQMFGKATWEFWISNSSMYFKPGLTWPLRASCFAPQALSAGCIFSVRGYAIIAPKEELFYLLGLCASHAFDYLFKLMLGRFGFPEFIVGVLQKIPMPRLDTHMMNSIGNLAAKAWGIKRAMDTSDETTHTFVSPAMVGAERKSLFERTTTWSSNIANANKTLADIQAQLDELCFDLYGFSANDREAAIGDAGTEIVRENFAKEKGGHDASANVWSLTAQLSDWLVGCLFGRWDIRIALEPSLAPRLSDTFDPLPICPPGMLVCRDGMPVKSGCIVSEEWLRARPDANTLPHGESVQNPTIPNSEYPIRISWDGVLVDDPGFNDDQLHNEDIIRRTREVLTVLWKDKVQNIEQETCDIFGISDLRTYFRKNFFPDHIKRYSKSRRKAPIYWQLSTPSASYSVWVYYHRFTKDTFYKIINEFVTPKLQFEERELTSARQQYGTNPTANQRKEIAARETFVGELKAFKEDVVRIAPLWNPNLNDGVIINFAPLWRLVPQNKPWQKECKNVWDKLVKGDYDWAHLAMHLWPERVVPKCTIDRSLAIAHGLDEILWEEDEKGKCNPKDVSPETLGNLINDRTSITVKAALEDLLNAPVPTNMTGKKRKRKN